MQDKISWIRTVNLKLSVSARAHAQFLHTYPTKKHVYVPHGRNNWCTSIYIQKLLHMWIVPSGWKGSVTHGLGADISLPQCLATGIWNLVPKAITGPKSRGTSFGTTLWRHVQRYCAKILAFMLILWSSNESLKDELCHHFSFFIDGLLTSKKRYFN